MRGIVIFNSDFSSFVVKDVLLLYELRQLSRSTIELSWALTPVPNVLGYGIMAVMGKETQMLAMGVIDLRKVSDVYLKLGRIYERVMGVIDAFHPDELAIEAPFFGKNVQSMLKLGAHKGW